MKTNFYNKNNGFSLAIVLLLITVLGGFLGGIVINSGGQSTRLEAEIAGWEGAKIARAARIFVRDELANNANLANELNATLGTGPRDIPVSTLIGEAMLPNGFAREQGGEFFNALGQRIRIIMANFPVDGDPALDTTVPTAYVYYENSNKSNGSLIQDIVQEARREGVAVSAPLFNGGANISGDCNGEGDSAVVWDTGCMSDLEFTALTGDNFVEGSLIIPAWRSVNFDARALLRFPQPESTGFPTMLTELEMGEPNDCDTNPNLFITIPADDGTPDASEICSSVSDSGATIDNRRDIIGVRNIEAESIIANPQVGDDVFIDTTTGIATVRANETHALDIAGSLNATGDAKVYDGDVTVTGDLIADKNIFVTRTDAGTPLSASIGSVRTGNSTSDGLIVTERPDLEGNIAVQGDVAINGAVNVSNSLVTQNLQMTGGAANNMNVSGDANMLGSSQFQTVNISGAGSTGSYSYVSGEFNTSNDLTVNGSVNSSDSLSFLGTTTVSTMNVYNPNGSIDAECLDDCPQRELDEFCRNITGMTYAECRQTFQ